MKYHLVVERKGIPLAVSLSAANTHDATQLLSLLDAIPSIIGPRGKPGRPRNRPAKLHADKAHDSTHLRRALRSPGCSAVATSASATSGGPTCSKGCYIWPVP